MYFISFSSPAFPWNILVAFSHFALCLATRPGTQHSSHHLSCPCPIYEACTTKTYLRMLMNVLQSLKKIVTGIRTKVLLVQKSWLQRVLWAATWSTIPQPLAHCHWTWSYSCRWLPLMWHSHGDKSGLCAGCLNTAYCMAFSWSCTLWATWGWK
jgi:hypothetical protein